MSDLELKVTVDPLLDAGPLLLPAALLPQLTLDTGPLDLQFDHVVLFSRTKKYISNLLFMIDSIVHQRSKVGKPKIG